MNEIVCFSIIIMANFPLVLLFSTLNVFVLSYAAPSQPLESIELKNLTELLEPEQPIRYDGAQLWSVEFSDDRTRRVVVGLKRDFGWFFLLF